MRKFILVSLFVGLAAFAGAWFRAGRAEGPRIDIQQPERFIGLVTPLAVTVESPGGQFARLDISLEQDGRSHPVFSLSQPAQDGVRQIGRAHV